MNPGSVRILRILARRRGDVGEMASTVLELEGEVPLAEESGLSMSPAAIRKRRERERDKERDSHAVTSRVTAGGVGGGLLPDLPDPEGDLLSETTSLSGGSGGSHAVMSRVTVTPDVTQREVRQTDDGASGMSVDAWCAGVQVATGKPQTRPLPRVCGQLVAAFLTHCPKGDDVVAWAQGKGEEWGRTLRAGRSVNPFDFVGWLGAPDGAPAASSGPTETEAQRNARIDRETEERAEAHRRALGADKEQDGRARAALARGASSPTRLGVSNG